MSKFFAPREPQRIARDFILAVQRPALFAVPGLGKTSTIYSVLDTLKLVGSNFFPVLVIAPLNVCKLVWPTEQKKWHAFADLKVVSIVGDSRDRDSALMTRGDVYLINYENVQWIVERFAGRQWPFRIVVADESTRLKSFRLKGQGGKRSAALATVAESVGRWINLSGTPAPNGLKDLWGQIWFQDFGARLGRSHTDFMRRWFSTNPYTRVTEPFPHAEKQIHEAISDITIAFRAEDWLDIKKPNFIVREVELPPEARLRYDKMERDFFIELELREEKKEITAMTQAALSNKLLQMASGGIYDENSTAHYIHDAKIEAVRSLMEELGGEPLLLAYWYRYEVPMLQKAFPEFRVFKTAKDQDEWNAGKIPLMGVHPASAGHGIDLQYGGRALAFFTQTWDLELRMQVIERIGPLRQLQAGFDRSVLIYDIIARNTLDSVVLERTTTKRSIQDALMCARAHRLGDAEMWQPVA